MAAFHDSELSAEEVAGWMLDGALHDSLSRLASAEINVTAVNAVSSGAGRYGALLW